MWEFRLIVKYFSQACCFREFMGVQSVFCLNLNQNGVQSFICLFIHFWNLGILFPILLHPQPQPLKARQHQAMPNIPHPSSRMPGAPASSPPAPIRLAMRGDTKNPPPLLPSTRLFPLPALHPKSPGIARRYPPPFTFSFWQEFLKEAHLNWHDTLLELFSFKLGLFQNYLHIYRLVFIDWNDV